MGHKFFRNKQPLHNGNQRYKSRVTRTNNLLEVTAAGRQVGIAENVEFVEGSEDHEDEVPIKTLNNQIIFKITRPQEHTYSQGGEGG